MKMLFHKHVYCRIILNDCGRSVRIQRTKPQELVLFCNYDSTINCSHCFLQYRQNVLLNNLMWFFNYFIHFGCRRSLSILNNCRFISLSYTTTTYRQTRYLKSISMITRLRSFKKREVIFISYFTGYVYRYIHRLYYLDFFHTGIFWTSKGLTTSEQKNFFRPWLLFC